jgi:hypothetical protein
MPRVHRKPANGGRVYAARGSARATKDGASELASAAGQGSAAPPTSTWRMDSYALEGQANTCKLAIAAPGSETGIHEDERGTHGSTASRG